MAIMMMMVMTIIIIIALGEYNPEGVRLNFYL